MLTWNLLGWSVRYITRPTQLAQLLADVVSRRRHHSHQMTKRSAWRQQYDSINTYTPPCLTLRWYVSRRIYQRRTPARHAAVDGKEAKKKKKKRGKPAASCCWYWKLQDDKLGEQCLIQIMWRLWVCDVIGINPSVTKKACSNSYKSIQAYCSL